MRKVVSVLLLLVIAEGVYYYLIPGKDAQKQSLTQEKVSGTVTEKTETLKQKVENDQEIKLQKMQARYADLKESRKKTRRLLSRLSSRLRHTEFPPEQARKISQKMRRANYQLKNPKLLGAFSDIQEIEHEIEKFNDINAKLDEIKKLLDAKRKNKS